MNKFRVEERKSRHQALEDGAQCLTLSLVAICRGQTIKCYFHLGPKLTCGRRHLGPKWYSIILFLPSSSQMLLRSLSLCNSHHPQLKWFVSDRYRPSLNPSKKLQIILFFQWWTSHIIANPHNKQKGEKVPLETDSMLMRKMTESITVRATNNRVGCLF